MCIFSAEIEWVAGTGIFVRADGDRQVLIYRMSVATPSPVAMVLPLPTPPGPAEDAVEFVDFSGYDELFRDLAKGIFPVPASAGPPSASAPPPQTLVVHTVGNFEASFVPRVADFDRLDERFRLSPEVWAALPQYADWSFAVFQLAAGNAELHPMAFTFPRRDPDRLYFPTVHVHDGVVHDEAQFDHQLFYQQRGAYVPEPPRAVEPGEPVPWPEWMPSFRTVENFVDMDRTQGLLDPTRHAFGRAMHGVHPNADVFIDDPA